ncbi:MAG: PorT family protein [Muribaculaceae bacterium]|nr:PorT family protein [Muribaculaceae bacterium]MDY6294481.1 outer membrane beta-barrel protein [Bacteroidales bacterium]MDY6411596.1 outer membrane beta-barrel protein [Bacteroidales bacterium]
MKRILTLALVALVAAMPLVAQRHNYGPGPGNRYDYERSGSRWIRNYYGKDLYFGLRIGPAFSHVSGDAIDYASSSKTGLHLGGVVGFGITNRAPVFFETGLSYVNKGGKSNYWTTSLSYLELPLTFKYIHYTDIGLSIHPLFGGYLAVGIDGSIKDFANKTKVGAFGSSKEEGVDRFKRFDGGLRVGCGVGFSMFYLDLVYDIGLANVSHNDYDSSCNRTLYLNFGVNF